MPPAHGRLVPTKMAAQSTQSYIQAGGGGDIGSNVGSSSNSSATGGSHMDYMFQTPEKISFKGRRWQGQPQDVDVAAGSHRQQPFRTATSPAPSISPGSSSALRRKILQQLTPSSEMSTPSWHTAVDGPLTPETAKVVSLRETPRTPVRGPFGRFADKGSAKKAATPTPGKTCMKWMRAKKMKSVGNKYRSKSKMALCLQPQPQRLTFL